MKFSCKVILIILFMPMISWAQALSKHTEWQWSVAVNSVISGETNDHPRAFLWIPSNCKHVKGVVVGQHNMIEEGIFEHPVFRKTLSDLGFAIVWVTPGINITFDFNNHADLQFNEMMKSLSDLSGYSELEFAPAIPLGHSAYASFPWNFAAWNSNRTLAAISIHGDTPLTKLTGSGIPNPDWGSRTIEGVPGLFVMGEYEWWEKRMTPGFAYVSKFPKTPLSFFADAGHGHFDYSDEMIEYISAFIRKAAKYRLPNKTTVDKAVKLKPIDPAKGWLMDKWRKDSLPLATAAPYKKFKGKIDQASWVFDEEMARETEKFYSAARGKEKQFVGFIQSDSIVKPKGGHANFILPFIPLKDGVSFRLKAFFTDTSNVKAVTQHASTPLVISRICGPVVKLDDSTFQIRFYRMGLNNSKRSNDIWLLASNKGDKNYKSAVQQLNLRFPLINKEGKEQRITFPVIQNQKNGISAIKLDATSDANVPVHYYIKEGPAEINGDTVTFLKIPPKAKFPVKVSVVAWQYGNVESKLQSAEPVERSFYITK